MDAVKKAFIKLKCIWLSFYNCVDWTYITMLGIVWLGYIFIHDLSGETLLEHCHWDSYTLQASRWLQGAVDIGENYEHLEIAKYQGKYFVSFPPFPSVLMLPWVMIYGENTPNNIIMIIYVMIALTLVYVICRYFNVKRNYSAFWSVVVVLGCNMLWMSTMGAVWFQAQLVNMILLLASIYAALNNNRVISYLCVAFAVGCRPFSIVYFFVLIAYYYSKDYRKYKVDNIQEASNLDMSEEANKAAKIAYNIDIGAKTRRDDEKYIDANDVEVTKSDEITTESNGDQNHSLDEEKQEITEVVENTNPQNKFIVFLKVMLEQYAGLVAAACVGLLYMIYNYVRFDSLFEFGHNYLPEFIESPNGQFNIKYVPKNLYRVFIRGIEINDKGGLDFTLFNGFWMHIANPLFLILAIYMITSLYRIIVKKEKLDIVKLTIIITLVMNVFLLCMHKTLGGWQFGNRYLVDLIPMSFLYILLTKRQVGTLGKLSNWEVFIGIVAILFNLYGAVYVNIQNIVDSNIKKLYKIFK